MASITGLYLGFCHKELFIFLYSSYRKKCSSCEAMLHFIISSRIGFVTSLNSATMVTGKVYQVSYYTPGSSEKQMFTQLGEMEMLNSNKWIHHRYIAV